MASEPVPCEEKEFEDAHRKYREAHERALRHAHQEDTGVSLFVVGSQVF
jgi:hypothetical protein